MSTEWADLESTLKELCSKYNLPSPMKGERNWQPKVVELLKRMDTLVEALQYNEEWQAVRGPWNAWGQSVREDSTKDDEHCKCDIKQLMGFGHSPECKAKKQ